MRLLHLAATLPSQARPQRRAQDCTLYCEIQTVTCSASRRCQAAATNQQEMPIGVNNTFHTPVINNIVPVVLSLSGNEVSTSRHLRQERGGLEQPLSSKFILPPHHLELSVEREQSVEVNDDCSFQAAFSHEGQEPIDQSREPVLEARHESDVHDEPDVAMRVGRRASPHAR